MKILGMVASVSIIATVVMGIVLDVSWQIMLPLGISYIALGIYGKWQAISLGGKG